MQTALALATTLVVAVVTAMVGLWIWRTQQIAKRRLEVAEEAMVAFWEAAAVLEYARARGIRSGEGSSRGRGPAEGDSLARKRDTAFIPRERLVAGTDAFGRLTKCVSPLRYYLGEGAVAAVNVLLEARLRVFVASDVAIEAAEFPQQLGAGVVDETWRDLFAMQGNDPLWDKVSEAERVLNQLCDQEARTEVAFFPWRVRPPARWFSEP